MKRAYMAVSASSGPILWRRSVRPPADAPGQAQSRGACAGECSRLAGQRATADLEVALSGVQASAMAPSPLSPTRDCGSKAALYASYRYGHREEASLMSTASPC